MSLDAVKVNNACIICDTPYQVMVALMIIHTTDIFNDSNIDFYVGNKFVAATELTERLKELDFVRNAICFNYFQGSLSKIVSQIGKLNPKWALKKLAGSNIDFSYDYIFASLTTYFEMLICCKNPTANLFFFEDGIGNYISDFASAKPIWSIRLLKLFHKEIPSFLPSRIYLFCPELIKPQKNVVEKIGLLSLDDLSFVNLLFNIFNVNENVMAKYQLFFLQTPYQDFNNKERLSVKKIDSDIISILETRKDRCIVRAHPRQNEIIKGDLPLDNKNKMWELECANKIDDHSILLSFYSTGQFTPKILYGKEPWILFTYRLVYQDEAIAAKSMDEFIQRFKTTYSNPNKIIVLKSVKQLKNILKKIMI